MDLSSLIIPGHASFRPAPEVYSVLLVAGLQSLYFIVKKPWCPRAFQCSGAVCAKLPVRPTLEEAATSPIVPIWLLLLYRLLLVGYAVYLQSLQLRATGTFILKYYTIWTWNLITLYFLLAALASATHMWLSSSRRRRALAAKQGQGGSQTSDGDGHGGGEGGGQAHQHHQHQHHDAAGGLWACFLAHACAILFHVLCTASAIVTTVTWGVLVPMLLQSPDPKAVAMYRAMFHNFISYNQHGANLLFMGLDLKLNRIPFRWHMVGHVGCYSLVFACWALAYNYVTGKWLYPFLDTSHSFAFLAYLGLYACHWLFFLTMWLQCKMREAMHGWASRAHARAHGGRAKVAVGKAD